MCRPSSSAWADAISIIGDDARVLIVCTGNICRSPFIERLLQRSLDERRRDERRSAPGPRIFVHSAGTGAVTGSGMDERAAAQLVAHGGDPAGFRARDLTPALIAESDLVLTATRAHRGQVAVMYPKALRRVFTFCDFADLVQGVDGPQTGVTQGVDGPQTGVTQGVDGPQTGVTQGDSRAWVRQVTEQAAARRGLHPPLQPVQADIVDPFRREDALFTKMAQQVVGSIPAVVRALAG